jgi:hypothetical protein
MRVLKLPDLPTCEDFETVGPSGPLRANINGRGAAIECYLDVGSSPVVRWNNYNRDLEVYHGEILGKSDIAKRFYAIVDANEKYDFTKVAAVLDMIIGECIILREGALLEKLEGDIEAESGSDSGP